MTETTAAPAKAAQERPSPAQRHEAAMRANATARKEFTQKYEGAVIKLNTKLGNRAVIRAYSRSFEVSQRNWYVATTVPRSVLGNSELASAAETGMLEKIKGATEHLKKKIIGAEVVAKDAGVDFSLIDHGREHVEETRVIGPVSMKLREFFLTCDKYMDLIQALYAYGEMPGDEHSKQQHEVKRAMEAVVTSIRNRRRQVLEMVNQAGKAREGYRKVVVDGEEAGEVKDPSNTDAKVVPLGTASASSGDAGAVEEQQRKTA